MAEPLTIKCKLVGPEGQPIEEYIRAIAGRLHEARTAGSTEPVKIDITLTADRSVQGAESPPGESGTARPKGP